MLLILSVANGCVQDVVWSAGSVCCARFLSPVHEFVRLPHPTSAIGDERRERKGMMCRTDELSRASIFGASLCVINVKKDMTCDTEAWVLLMFTHYIYQIGLFVPSRLDWTHDTLTPSIASAMDTIHKPSPPNNHVFLTHPTTSAELRHHLCSTPNQKRSNPQLPPNFPPPSLTSRTFSLICPIHCAILSIPSARSSTKSVNAQSLKLGSPSSLIT